MLQEIQDQGGGRCCLLYGLLEEQEVQPAHGVPEEEEMQPVVSVPEAIKSPFIVKALFVYLIIRLFQLVFFQLSERGLRMSLS